MTCRIRSSLRSSSFSVLRSPFSDAPSVSAFGRSASPNVAFLLGEETDCFSPQRSVGGSTGGAGEGGRLTHHRRCAPRRFPLFAFRQRTCGRADLRTCGWRTGG